MAVMVVVVVVVLMLVGLGLVVGVGRGGGSDGSWVTRLFVQFLHSRLYPSQSATPRSAVPPCPA